jgi:hypothetical protein
LPLRTKRRAWARSWKSESPSGKTNKRRCIGACIDQDCGLWLRHSKQGWAGKPAGSFIFTPCPLAPVVVLLYKPKPASLPTAYLGLVLRAPQIRMLERRLLRVEAGAHTVLRWQERGGTVGMVWASARQVRCADSQTYAGVCEFVCGISSILCRCLY